MTTPIFLLKRELKERERNLACNKALLPQYKTFAYKRLCEIEIEVQAKCILEFKQAIQILELNCS